MITLNEIKIAISKIADTEIIQDDKDEKKGRVKFKRNNDYFTIYFVPESILSKTNLRMSLLIRLPEDKNITKEEGELIEATTNIINNTPCKAVYIYNTDKEEKQGRFFITNFYTDKLDQFEKFVDEKVKAANIVVLILGMMLEIIVCAQEVMAQAGEAIEKRKQGLVTDGN